MEVLPFTHTDLDALQELQPAGWDNITPAFNFYLGSNFCFPVKIVVNGKVIGTGVSIIHDDVAWLAHIIVHADYRNKGIGKHITQYLIDRIPVKCKTIYLIATDLGEPVYKKLGFVTETDYAFYKDGSFGTDITLSSNILPFKEEYLNQLLAIDKEASGENREMHLKEYLQGSFVLIENNKVKAYYLPEFGNGLIIGIDTVAGIELMKLRSKKYYYFILPADNKAATDCLIKHNYVHFRTAKRMILGTNRPWQPMNMYNRISGQIG